jgi:hypothetical protein
VRHRKDGLPISSDCAIRRPLRLGPARPATRLRRCLLNRGPLPNGLGVPRELPVPVIGAGSWHSERTHPRWAGPEQVATVWHHARATAGDSLAADDVGFITGTACCCRLMHGIESFFMPCGRREKTRGPGSIRKRNPARPTTTRMVVGIIARITGKSSIWAATCATAE